MLKYAIGEGVTTLNMSPGEKAHLPEKLGPCHKEKRPKTKSKRAPNRSKLCRSGPCSPRGLQNKYWAKTAPLGCACTPGALAPLQAHLEPIFGGISPTDVAKAVT